jgi:hypothetical protein
MGLFRPVTGQGGGGKEAQYIAFSKKYMLLPCSPSSNLYVCGDGWVGGFVCVIYIVVRGKGGSTGQNITILLNRHPDLSAVHPTFTNGVLTTEVQRFNCYIYSRGNAVS